MKIEVNIPALDRLCDILEKGLPQFPSTTPATAKAEAVEQETKAEPAPKVKATKATKAEPVEVEVKKPEEVTPAEPKGVEAPTAESVTELAKLYVSKASPADLRKLLDDAGIKGQKISTCDKKFYPAIEAALKAAIDG